MCFRVFSACDRSSVLHDRSDMSDAHIQGKSLSLFYLLFTYLKNKDTPFRKTLPLNNQPEAVEKQLFAPLDGSKHCMLTSTKNTFPSELSLVRAILLC